MKKIYYIANARMPTERAHGIQLAKMCEALLDAGAVLELVLPRRATDHHSIKDIYGLRRDIPVRRLLVIDVYRFGRIGFYIGSVSFMLSYIFFILWKKVMQEDFFIYTIDMDQFSFACIPLLRTPYAIEMHDSKKRSLLYAWVLRRAWKIVTINSIIKKELSAAFSISPEKIAVHPNGIDIGFFDVDMTRGSARRMTGLPIDGSLILYGGQYYAWKGFEIFPEMARSLGRGITVAIIGADREEVKNALNDGDFPQSLEFFGKQSFIKMPIWYKAADVLIVLGTKKNHYSYFHTSPMKLFEYMASKRPIVAADTPAIREIVSEKEALFYEPDNAESMAQAIRAVLKEPEAANERARQAFEKVKRFAWDKRGREVLSFIFSKS